MHLSPTQRFRCRKLFPTHPDGSALPFVFPLQQLYEVMSKLCYMSMQEDLVMSEKMMNKIIYYTIAAATMLWKIYMKTVIISSKYFLLM